MARAGPGEPFTTVLESIAVLRLRTGHPRTCSDRDTGRQGLHLGWHRSYLRRCHTKATIPRKADQDAGRNATGSAGGRPWHPARPRTGSGTQLVTTKNLNNSSNEWIPVMIELPTNINQDDYDKLPSALRSALDEKRTGPRINWVSCI